MPIAPTPATSSSKQEFKDVPPAILINPAPAVAFDRLSLFQPNPLDIDWSSLLSIKFLQTV